MNMIDDKREIRSVWSSGVGFEVGKCGVTKILPYTEHGQSMEVPWFQIWTGECFRYRVNAAFIEGVEYMPEAPE